MCPSSTSAIGGTGLLAWTFKRSAQADLRDVVADRGEAVNGREAPIRFHRTLLCAPKGAIGESVDGRGAVCHTLDAGGPAAVELR